MGAGLDWLNEVVERRGWKIFRFNFFPGYSQVVCAHPDSARVVLQKGHT